MAVLRLEIGVALLIVIPVQLNDEGIEIVIAGTFDN
jgi:hypothetical protein